MKLSAVYVICLLAAMPARAEEAPWKQLPSLPDKEGFAGSFAGVSHGSLVVAGGANFPGKKPWEGGTKVWVDTIFVLDAPDGAWRVAGKLPRPLGYGVSVTHGDGVVCVGGSDANRHYADAFRLTLDSGKITVTALPPLPMTIANGCGAIVGDTLYIVCGQEKPDSTEALQKVFAIDLAAAKPAWKEIEAWPGPGRILATAGAFNGALWVMGGAELFAGDSGKVERRYLTDAYRYDPTKGWKRIADLPHPSVAAPTPAVSTTAGPLLFGGDDGTQVGVTSDVHRGFPNEILQYDSKTNTWRTFGALAAPRVTVPLVQWNNLWVIPSGEAKPGIRSPEVWAATSLTPPQEKAPE